jgi:glutaryl-CoA dehydrogenase
LHTTKQSLAALDDLLGWEFGLSPHLLDVRARTESALASLRPQIDDWYASGEPPVHEIAKVLGSAGLLAPRSQGEQPGLQYGLICAALEGCDSGLRTFASVQGSLAMGAISRYGTPQAQEEWIPGLTQGTLIGSFALTEPDIGSDPSNIQTTAEQVPGGYKIDGVKRWVSNGQASDVIVTWARTSAGISAFAVPSRTPGVSISPIPAKASLRASATAEVAFDAAVVPGSTQLVGARGIGAALRCLNEARFGIIFGSVGAARDGLQSALQYCLTRHQFAEPLARFQLTQAKLAHATADIARAWQLALHLAARKDAGMLTPAEVSLGKLSNVRMALDVVRTMRTVLGANGTTLAYSPIRHAANLESVLTYEGTEEMHTLILGSELTGINAFV